MCDRVMNDDREPRAMDPRVHTILDGDIPSSDAAAFEGDLRPGTHHRNQLETFMHLGAWFRATRPRAPSTLSLRVMEAIERPPRGVRPSPPAPGKRIQVRIPRPWVWIPAAMAAAVLIVLWSVPPTRVLGPSDGPPPPSERAASQEVPATVAVPGTGPRIAAAPSAHDQVRYVFTVKAEHAQQVCLAGDFNLWKVCDARLARVGEDVWSIAVDLPRGRHEYMFVIDGRWVTDPNAMGYSQDGFGNRNAVLVI
jgi:hypothetical protein